MQTKNRRRLAAGILSAGLVLPGVWRWATPELSAQARPNIVLMFPDNLGWGEVGVYGSVRGAADAAHRQDGRARASG